MNTWHIATVGQLSRNKFWGEDETQAHHPVLATSTVIQSEHGNILVDPSLQGDDMAQAVFNCSGVKAEDIAIIYSTHLHYDHWLGLDAFPNAQAYTSAGELQRLEWIVASFAKHKVSGMTAFEEAIHRIKPVENELVPGVPLISLSGHTMGLHGLLFDAPEGKVLASGDAVMNCEFFRARQGYYSAASPEKANASIRHAGEVADYIIPGHGNYFAVKAYPYVPSERKYEWEEESADTGRINMKTPVQDVLEDPSLTAIFQRFLPPEYGLPLLILFSDISIGAMLFPTRITPEKRAELFRELNR